MADARLTGASTADAFIERLTVIAVDTSGFRLPVAARHDVTLRNRDAEATPANIGASRNGVGGALGGQSVTSDFSHTAAWIDIARGLIGAVGEEAHREAVPVVYRDALVVSGTLVGLICVAAFFREGARGCDGPTLIEFGLTEGILWTIDAIRAAALLGDQAIGLAQGLAVSVADAPVRDRSAVLEWVCFIVATGAAATSAPPATKALALPR